MDGKHQRATAILVMNVKRASNTDSLQSFEKESLCIHSIARREEKDFRNFSTTSLSWKESVVLPLFMLFCAADEAKNRIHSPTRFI